MLLTPSAYLSHLYRSIAICVQDILGLGWEDTIEYTKYVF